MTSVDWETFYIETLDGLLATVEAADIQWATDMEDGRPWIIPAQRRPSGIDYPHAMVLRFVARRDEAESSRRHELMRIDASVSVFREGDPHDHEQNFRQAIRDLGAVQTALYEDRSLGGACDYLVVDQADAFSLENTNSTTETVADLQLTITKDADHPRP